MIIAEYCEKIGHHEFQAAHAEEECRILREELRRQQLEFREVHNKVLQIWRNYENSKVLHSIRKTKAHREPPEHYFGIIKKITGITK